MTTTRKPLATTRRTELALPAISPQIIVVTDVATIRQIIREELEAVKAFPPYTMEDRQLTLVEFREKFKVKSYSGVMSLRKQGCPFTGEGKATRISEQAATKWFNDRNK